MLMPEQVDQYTREGDALAPSLLDAAEVAGLVAELEGICVGNTLADHSEKLEMEPQKPLQYEKLVRGVRRQVARITYSQFPIPKQRRTTASLYELQEQSR